MVQDVEEVDDLEETERGAGGFGSTGVATASSLGSKRVRSEGENKGDESTAEKTE